MPRSAAGHKGYALALLIEAMTDALAGFGRLDPKEGWGATVRAGARPRRVRRSRRVAAPNGMAGQRLPPRRAAPGGPSARLPGERGLALAREQSARGVALHPTIMPALLPWAGKLGVRVPGLVRSTE